MQDLKKEISIRIKKFLEENNITRKEFLSMLNMRGANITASALQFWYNGQKEPRGESKKILFDILGISVNDTNSQYGEVKLVKFPVLGVVACGKPLNHEVDKDCFVMADLDIKLKYKPDFCVFAKGDSMEPLIHDGDIIFVKSQPNVDNGQLAVIEIDDEACVKRIFQDNDKFTLVSINSKYPPMIYTKEELQARQYRICGLPVFMQTTLFNK